MKLYLTEFIALLFLVIGFCSCDLVIDKNKNNHSDPKVDTAGVNAVQNPIDTLENHSKAIDPITMKKVDTTRNEASLISENEPTIDALMGKIELKGNPEFEVIAPKHCSDKGMYLRKDVYEAFKKMYAAAIKDGVRLRIISATRPFARQKLIWEAKWTGARLVGGKDLSKSIPDSGKRALKILEYSSMPGTSRHHWGTDIDINNLENSYFESGNGKKEYEWLVNNAPGYGFCQPYTEKNESRLYGYEEEKWHWSFIPVSKKLTNAYKERVTEDMIGGFKGSESAKIIGVIEKYVLGINHDCLK